MAVEEAPVDRMTGETRMTRTSNEPLMTTPDTRMTAEAAVCTTAMPAGSGDGRGGRSDHNDQNRQGGHCREESLQRQ